MMVTAWTHFKGFKSSSRCGEKFARFTEKKCCAATNDWRSEWIHQMSPPNSMTPIKSINFIYFTDLLLSRRIYFSTIEYRNRPIETDWLSPIGVVHVHSRGEHIYIEVISFHFSNLNMLIIYEFYSKNGTYIYINFVWKKTIIIFKLCITVGLRYPTWHLPSGHLSTFCHHSSAMLSSLSFAGKVGG